jgi:hypothetical protein
VRPKAGWNMTALILLEKTVVTPDKCNPSTFTF